MVAGAKITPTVPAAGDQATLNPMCWDAASPRTLGRNPLVTGHHEARLARFVFCVTRLPVLGDRAIEAVRDLVDEVAVVLLVLPRYRHRSSRSAPGAGSARTISTMPAIHLLEQRLADAWPPMAEEYLGHRRLRAAGGFTGRANRATCTAREVRWHRARFQPRRRVRREHSAITAGEPGVETAEALRSVVAFAKRHRIPPTAHVVVGSRTERDLAEHGWTVNLAHPGGAESSVLVTALDGTGASDATAVHATPPPGWWELAAGSADPSPAQRHVLGTGDLVGFGVYRPDGGVVAAVRGAVVGDLLHVARLAVDPGHRRRGIAGALMGGIAAWGSRHGAIRGALQVSLDNPGALALYRGLGFTEHHRYRYWVPGESATCEDRQL